MMKKLKTQNIIKIKKKTFFYFNNENLKNKLYEYNILLNLNNFKICENQNQNKNLSKLLSSKNNILVRYQNYNNTILFSNNITYFILLSFHNHIIKTIFKTDNKKINFFLLIKEKKKIQTFFEFYDLKYYSKNIKKNNIKKDKTVFFFILFSYIFMIKNSNTLFFKIKSKKFSLYKRIKKKKLTFFEKKKFSFFLIEEEHLKRKDFNIKKNNNKYVLSRINYLKSILK